MGSLVHQDGHCNSLPQAFTEMQVGVGNTRELPRMEAAYANFSLFFFSLQSIGEQMVAKAGTLCCSHEPLRRLCRTSQQPLILPSFSMASDAILSTETVSIVTLSLTWKNGTQNIPLGADVRDESFQSPGARTQHSQLLWSRKHQDTHLGAC